MMIVLIKSVNLRYKIYVLFMNYSTFVFIN